jgi:hypothetical protein
MTRTLTLALFLLAGCVPVSSSAPDSSGPTPDPRATAGDPDVLHCATAAFDDGTLQPIAIRIREDFSGDNASWSSMSIGAALPDQEGVVAAPTASWDEQTSITLTEDELLFGGVGTLVVEAARHPDFSGRMYVGTLSYGELGVHDVTCWFDDFVSDFTYVPGEGCFDADGQAGHNPLPIPYLRDTGDAHCARFDGQMINEDFLGYPTFLGLDLRGARMESAALYFAHILESRWEGADLTGFDFGYAMLSGTVDASTVLPETSCETDDGWLDCMR